MYGAWQMQQKLFTMLTQNILKINMFRQDSWRNIMSVRWVYVKIQYKDTSDMNFYVWTKKKAPNLYQLGANDNEKETLIDCTSASAVFFYQIKSFVSILEDESARFFAVSFIMMLVSRIQGTARVVNYAGLVRGETQRIIKLEGAGLPQDGMIEDVASFAAFAARLNRSRFRPARIFRSIMISAFRCPSRSMKSRSKNKLPPNAWQKRQHMLI